MSCFLGRDLSSNAKMEAFETALLETCRKIFSSPAEFAGVLLALISRKYQLLASEAKAVIGEQPCFYSLHLQPLNHNQMLSKSRLTSLLTRWGTSMAMRWLYLAACACCFR